MKNKFITASIRVGSETEKKDGFFGREKNVTHRGFCSISELSNEINTTCNNMHVDGYDVISIMPITRGDWSDWNDGGYGFSVTDGVIITAKLID